MLYDKSKVSIIIATKNEGQGIKKILESVRQYSNDILVVDGHSNDETEKIAIKLGARFFLDNKKGRGDAIRIGIKNAKNQILVLFDADGSHEENDIPRFVEPILQGKADLVIGSRRTGGSFDIDVSITGIIRSAGCDFLVSLVNNKFKTKLTDILYSFRSIRASSAKRLNLKANDFLIEQEVVVSSLKHKLKILEIPSREKARGWGESKLHTLTGIKFFLILLKDLYL